MTVNAAAHPHAPAHASALLLREVRGRLRMGWMGHARVAEDRQLGAKITGGMEWARKNLGGGGAEYSRTASGSGTRAPESGRCG